MRVILCGGGTAGHVNPAVAIAEEIKKREPDSEILFIGREGGKENRAVEAAGFKLLCIKVSGLRRSLSPKNVVSIINVLRATAEAKRIIKGFSPEIVIGTGGYVCYPVLKAARALRVKTAIHESNAVAGMTTRLLSKGASKVLLNYKSCISTLPRKDNTVVVGNPLRKEFGVIPRQKARSMLGIKNDEIFILSFGGSIGAMALNEACLSLMENYSVKNGRIRHIHAVGERYFDECKHEDLKRGKNGCRVVDYINDMPRLLSAADITVTRSGALTLSEISAAGAAAILIPSPNVTGDHQKKNAETLTKSGAAILLTEEGDLAEKLKGEVARLVENEKERKALSERIRGFCRKNASELIYTELKGIL